MDSRAELTSEVGVAGASVLNETYAQRVNRVVEKVFTTDYKGEPLDWAVFAAGTVVMVPASKALAVDALIKVAQQVLKDNGPICPGSSSGDFNAVQLTHFFGEGCMEWCVFFEVDGDAPQGTALFGVYMGDPKPSFAIGLEQRAAREEDSRDCQVKCTSLDLLVWSTQTHARFPVASRALVKLMLLIERRARIGSPFVSHEILVRFLLPMLVQ